MSDIWYYSDGNKSVGPVSLADLTAILSRISNAKDVLVWQNTFEHWKRAANVPELASFVIKPPPLPPLPPPLPPQPPALPHEPLIIPAVKAQDDRPQYQSALADSAARADSHKIEGINKIFGYIATAAVILLIAAALIYLPYSGSNVSSPSSSSVASFPSSESIISGKAREQFVAEGMKTCMKTQKNNSENVRLSLSNDAIVKYCSCYMNGLADKITNGDLSGPLKEGAIPANIREKMDKATASCQESLGKSLLGG